MNLLRIMVIGLQISLPNPAFGADSDLRTMISEAHKRDIWVMLDVVYNHVG